MRTGFMLLIALFVGGAMFATLTWFFRRLRRIAEDFWGLRSPSLKEELRTLGTFLFRRRKP